MPAASGQREAATARARVRLAHFSTLAREASARLTRLTGAITSTNFKIGYARVSTVAQDEALQLDAIERAHVDRVCTDHARRLWPKWLRAAGDVSLSLEAS